MVLLPAVGIGLIIGFLTRGSLAGFSQARFRWLPVLVLAVFIQVLIFTPLLGETAFVLDYGHLIYMGTILMTLAVFTRNLHIPGLVVILIGALLNGVVIFANGGFMPTSAELLEEAGRLGHVEDRPTHTNSVIADDDTRLAFLGDIFALPESMPMSNVYSIGDIFIAVGAGATTARTMHLKPDEPESKEVEPAA